jgi:hypothetical protein
MVLPFLGGLEEPGTILLSEFYLIIFNDIHDVTWWICYYVINFLNEVASCIPLDTIK